MKRLERIKYEHAEMNALMSRLRRFGAADSEPQWNYEQSILNAIKGHDFENLTAQEWELYTNEKGVGRVAQKLNTQTRKIVKLILKARISEAGEIQTWAEDNLWRVI